MRTQEPFGPEDLADLDSLLDKAFGVIAMEDVVDGNHDPRFVAMRHDVDHELDSSVAMAKWEEERGYRSSYYFLHTEQYWQEKESFVAAIDEIADCGHEIGFHLNAITQAIISGRDPLDITQEAVDELRSYGYPVRGVVAHGDRACYRYHYVNDEIFTESRREGYGAADRTIGGVKLNPISRADLGFDYDPSWLSRGGYLSDSAGRWTLHLTRVGGNWSQPFEEIAARFPLETGQLHILVHPCWWANAFNPSPVTT